MGCGCPAGGGDFDLDLVPGEHLFLRGPSGIGKSALAELITGTFRPRHGRVLLGATAGLEPVAEARAENAFAARGGILVVIAHRPSSALRARRVLLLDGAGPALGDHETLLAISPRYAELMRVWHPTGGVGEVAFTAPPGGG